MADKEITVSGGLSTVQAGGDVLGFWGHSRKGYHHQEAQKSVWRREHARDHPRPCRNKGLSQSAEMNSGS